jgi:hypothetical protein
MNIENLAALSAHLRNLASNSEVGFNMMCWFEEDMVDYACRKCGTVGCIAGHAVWLFKREAVYDLDPPAIRAIAADLLGLAMDQAGDLFEGNIFGDVTPQQAADAIDRMIAGQPPWPHDPNAPGTRCGIL